MFGHEHIAFDEVCKVPWVMRCPSVLSPQAKIRQSVSSIDLTPTLLAALGFNTDNAGFDGVNALGKLPPRREVYFSDWKHEGPACFVQGGLKFLYNPTSKLIFCYDLEADPDESVRIDLTEPEAQQAVERIIVWRKNTVLAGPAEKTGRKTLFGRWLCRWNERDCAVKYLPEETN